MDALDFDNDLGDLELDFEHEFGGEISRVSRTLVPEKRLASPITTGLLERLLAYTNETADFYNWLPAWRVGKYDERSRQIREYMRAHPTKMYSSILKPLLQYSDMLEFVEESPSILNAFVYPELFALSFDGKTGIEWDYTESKLVYDRAVEEYLDYVSDCVKLPELKRIRKELSLPKSFPQRLYRSSQRSHLWDKVVESYRKSYSEAFRPKWRKIGPIKIMTGTGFALLVVTDQRSTLYNKPFLATYEQLQMVQDCTLGRHSIDVALELGLHNGTHDLVHYVDRVLKWQENCILAYGNDGYELVKAPEAVFKARLNSLTGGDILAVSSYQRTIDKIIDKEHKLGSVDTLTRQLDSIASSVGNLQDCVELFGLAKLSGHPTVFAKKSAESVRAEAMPRGTATVYHSRLLVRMFKHITLSAYIKEHSEWPPLTVRPLLDSQLRRFYNQRVTTLPLNSYPLSDLDNLEFGKFVEFDYSEDYLKFLDDKAISPGAKAAPSFWFGGETGESRRLLEKICKIPHLDTKKMVERMRKGKTTRDEEIVELTQKERELKTAARCYCKLPIEVRCFFTLTEYNLGEYFMRKYFPQQTMTMASSEVKTRLYNLVKGSEKKDRALLEVDFSRWNLRWRANTVDPIAFCLESIFGLDGVFSQAHSFFTRSTIVLTDKHSLPRGASRDISIHDWPESELLWRGHLGGFEGIQQKLWTICTVCMMYVVMYDANASFLMAGQGDNQIFALKFDMTDGESLREKLIRLLAVMQVRCFYLNHEVKPDECVDSSTVLTYSKDIYVCGVHMLYGLKFIARTLKVENLDVPSLSKEIAGVSATAVMISDNLNKTFLGYFWQCFQTLRLMTSREMSPNHKIEKQQSIELFRRDADCRVFALSLPGSLGGLPVQSWGRYFLKGEVDDLGWDVSSTLKLCKHNRSLSIDLKLLCDGKYTSRKVNRRNLILDPHSIPISRPEDALGEIKKSISLQLPGITHNGNAWIHQIVSSSTEASGEQLIQQLANTTPLYPQIMADIYSYSPAGVRESLLNRFNMTKTITAMTGNKSFLMAIEASNVRLLQYVHSRFTFTKTYKGNVVHHPDAFKVCATLRGLWGDGVEHKNIGVYCPLDMTLTSEPTSQPHILCTSRTKMSAFLATIGSYPPNFGTATRAKIGDHGIKLVTSSSTIGDIRALLITYSETGRSEYLRDIIDNIVRARTPWSLAALEPIFPAVYGGTAAHRHDALQASHFGILGSRTVPTHLNFSSDKTGYLAGGKHDYPFVFQEAYLLLTHVCQILSFSGSDSFANIKLILPGEMTPLEDSIVVARTLPEKPPGYIQWPNYAGNSLAYISQLQFKSIPDIPDPNVFQHVSHTKEPRGLIMSYLLATSKHKKSSITSERASSLLPVDLLDVAEFTSMSPHDLIAGAAAYVAIEGTFLSLQVAGKNADTESREIFIRLATSVSAPLSRLFLMDTQLGTKICDDLGIVLHPGSNGAPHAARALAGQIVEIAFSYIRGHIITSLHGYQLYLFEDLHAASNRVLLKYTTYWLATTHHKSLVKLTFSDRSLITASQLRAGAIGSSVQAAMATYRTGFNLLMNDRRDISKYNIERYSCHFVTLSGREALRILRNQQYTRTQTDHKEYISAVAYSSKIGQLRYTLSDDVGAVETPEQTYDRTDEQRSADLILSHLYRPIGRYSSAISVWATHLSRVRRQINNKVVMTIGVGHGATSRIALELNASKVIGVDLRSSFPRITQREASYVPPEIAHFALHDRFVWSETTWHGESDFLVNATSILSESPTAYIILDIETIGADALLTLNEASANRAYVARCFLTDDDLRAVIDICRPTKVFRLPFTTSASKTYIIEGVTNCVPRQAGNFLRVKLGRVDPYSPKFLKSLAPTTERINDLVREFGISIKEANLAELKNLPTKIRRIGTNFNDPKLLHALDDTYDLVSNMRPAVHDDIVSCAKRLLSMTPRVASELARFLSTSRTDVADIGDVIRERTPSI